MIAYFALAVGVMCLIGTIFVERLPIWRPILTMSFWRSTKFLGVLGAIFIAHSLVESLAEEAAKQQGAGKSQAAVDKYGAAVDMARQISVSESVLKDLYQKLESAVSSAVQEAVEQSTGQIKEDVLAHLRVLKAERSYELAVRYTKLGSPDLAKPLLKPATEGWEEVVEAIEKAASGLRDAMMLVGARNLPELGKVRIFER